MEKRRFYTWLSVAVMLMMSMNLVISTLHSHHNLELHKSSDFADTGQCLSADNLLCPICGYVIDVTDASTSDSSIFFKPLTNLKLTDTPDLFSRTYIPVLGRSPPSIA